jgi:hypothetical protein
MRSLRTLAALALSLLGLAVGVPSASAIDPFPFTGIQTLSSAHFLVHYNRNDQDTTCGDAISLDQAGDIAGMFERTYALYSSWGYPAPVDDGDGLIDVSVDDFGAACVSFGGIGAPSPLDRWDAVISPKAPLGAGDIHLDALDPTPLDDPTDDLPSYRVIAHELFHLFEDAMAPGADQWLQEGSAEWAASRATVAAGGVATSSGGSLDCVGSQCGDSTADQNGYPSWLLFEYLTERYHDDSKVKAVWTQAMTNPTAPATTDLAAVLDVPLSTFYNDFATAHLTGNFTFAPLTGVLPAPADSLVIGADSGSIPAGNVNVNHLSARYIALTHASNDGPCYEAWLTLNVAIPAGVTSQPAYYAATKGSSAQMLSISGSTASIKVPWNTCTDSPDAYISLPNDTLNLDGREFAVTGSVSVDRTRPATASSPPPGVYPIGSAIPVPTSDPVPSLRLYAPELLRVSSTTRLLRFVVFSSGNGKLSAVLGSTGLGTADLRSGNNDVRFVLPKALFNSLRTKSVSNVLQLTSMSPSGAKGATFTRHVVVQTPKPKKKPKKKH